MKGSKYPRQTYSRSHILKNGLKFVWYIYQGTPEFTDRPALARRYNEREATELTERHTELTSEKI
jgi:hypothetical protein